MHEIGISGSKNLVPETCSQVDCMDGSELLLPMQYPEAGEVCDRVISWIGREIKWPACLATG